MWMHKMVCMSAHFPNKIELNEKEEKPMKQNI